MFNNWHDWEYVQEVQEGAVVVVTYECKDCGLVATAINDEDPDDSFPDEIICIEIEDVELD